MALTNDRSRLLRALDAFRTQALPFRIEDAGEQVLRSVADLAARLAETPRGRKVIVGVGTGWVFDAPLPPTGVRDLQRHWVTAMRALASSHTSLYVLDPAGVGSPSGRYGGSSGFARETGGHAFLNTNDMADAASRIWDEAGTYYLLGVANPAVGRSGELRELEVKVRRKDVTVRARSAISAR